MKIIEYYNSVLQQSHGQLQATCASLVSCSHVLTRFSCIFYEQVKWMDGWIMNSNILEGFVDFAQEW